MNFNLLSKVKPVEQYRFYNFFLISVADKVHLMIMSELIFLISFRVRQFIEMVNGTDSEVRCLGGRSPKSQDSYPVSPRPFSPAVSPSHGMNIHNLASGKASTAHFSGEIQSYNLFHYNRFAICYFETVFFFRLFAMLPFSRFAIVYA